jgi:restriction system protein
MWTVEIRHPGLNKYRLVKGTDKYVVEQKAAAQMAAWEEMWQRKVEVKERAHNKQSKLEEAQSRTQEAQDAIEAIQNTLKQTLDVDDTIKWDALKDNTSFPQPKPEPPQVRKIPLAPVATALKYEPEIGFLDKLFSSRKENKIRTAKNLLKADTQSWEKQKLDILQSNDQVLADFQKNTQKWEDSQKAFLLKQEENNEAIEKRKAEYLKANPNAIVDYCELVLTNSQYPDYFPKEFELDYNPETKILIVEYSLPSYDDLPRLKEVKYVQSKDELVETSLPEAFLNKLYDSLVYQITLRTIHELYEADGINALASIVFNGWVESIDKATGKQVNACILSLQANRAEFLSVNLASVDPRLCFKNLKGVGSSKLHSLTPIAPVLTISREDKRFISSYEVADQLDESSNLAAMDWEDFEHLIRELFEKEFAQSGGEVKVTQASRDGGVDAIAFDPDPIRGGKIVIQAKRYTNTVGVSAVRDLFGTVMNEGATKGILVTTADYGPDAYEFAKGKPLTLLSGSNLLHLLDKHGHKAIIDLKAAKQILADKEKNSP